MRLRFVFLLLFFVAAGRAVAAVFINEIMWPGSDLSTADEWVELRADADTDISGWKLTTVVSSGEEEVITTFPAGTVLSSGSLTIIANYPASQSRLASDAAFITTAVSLPNTKLYLRLRNASGQVMDIADDFVGEPFAGANPSGGGPKASMERFGSSGALKLSWSTAKTTQGFDEGVTIFGTPGFPNGSFKRSSSSPSPSPNPSPSSSSSSEGIDLIPPAEAGEMTGTLQRGTLLVHWRPSLSLDLAAQRLQINPPLLDGTSVAVLDGTITSFQSTSVDAELEYEMTLISVDASGNASAGASISVQPLPKLKITEVLANPKGADDQEWIEIANLGSRPADLMGLILDEGNSPASFVIPAGTGSILGPGEYRAYRKSLTGLPLDNGGEVVSLKKGTIVLDSWAYIETAEEVSYGRSLTDPNSFQAFCVPTEGRPNDPLVLDPVIHIQSGTPVAAGKVTLNLEATVASGSLLSATCAWDYGEGFLSASCNPPSHTFSTVGTYSVNLIVNTYCINTVQRSLEVIVLPAGSAAPGHTDLPPPAFGGAPVAGCESTPAADVRISEAIPNPVGDETEEEWIELQNAGSTDAHLCGWILDDALEGSRPYTLSDTTIPPGGFLVLPRRQTGIALNNDSDSIRLLASDRALREIVSFADAPPGESYALRSDGNFVWTPLLTPGSPNRFRTAERRFPSDRVVVSAALPNPVGADKGMEWIELMNISDDSFALTDWFLDNKEGGSKPFSLDGILLGSMESRRFESKGTRLELVNTADSARLLDPDGNVVSILSWTDAVEGRIFRPYAFSTERVPAQVTRVIDGDTVEIILTDIDRIDRIPDSLRRRWLALAQSSGSAIRVRLIGIDTPETVHPFEPVQKYGIEASNYLRALIEGKNVELGFDTELWDNYQRLLAYVHLDDRLVQAEILRSGLAYAYLRFPFNRRAEFLAYESEARKAKLGLWSDLQSTSWADAEQKHIDQAVRFESKGLHLKMLPLGGLVDTGSIVTFETSAPAKIFLSVNSGSYLQNTGSFLILGDTQLRAFAEASFDSGSGSVLTETGTVIRSETIEANFVVAKSYATGALMISEIFASPAPDHDEWIEIENITDAPISLFGWQLDDKKGKGTSRPWNGSDAIIIPAHTVLTLSGSLTKIAFNNDGDDVFLISPNGAEVHIAYPKLARGQAYASCESGWWITDVPTPGKENICYQLPPELKPQKVSLAPRSSKSGGGKAKTAKTRASTRTAKRTIRYLNVLATENATGATFGIGPQTSDQVILLHLLASQKRPALGGHPPIRYGFEFEILALALAIMAFLRMSFSDSRERTIG